MLTHQKKRTLLPASLIAGFIILFGFGSLFGQQLEYAAHPSRPFDFKQIGLELQINPADSVIRGKATYKLQSFWNDADRIVMDAHRIDVQRVLINKQPAQYELQNDSLIVDFPNPVGRNEIATMQIIYEASPLFAWQVSDSGTVFSSFFPERRAYLFPIIDNPWVTARFDVDFKVPDSLQVVTNGELVGKDTVRNGLRISHWSTDKAIPVTDWGFTVGKFDHSASKTGPVRVNVFSEEGIINADRRDSLIKTAVQQVSAASKLVDGAFPYESLNIVVLPDHRWEMKSYGAGYGYLFMNKGGLDAQLRRIVDAQWAGVKIRSSRFIDADLQIVLQAWMADSLDHGKPDTLSLEDSPPHHPSMYADYSISNWNRWLNYFRDSTNTRLREMLDQQVPKMLNVENGVFDWSDFDRIWYASRGQWFDLPVPPSIKKPTRLVYQMDYSYDASAGKLQLIVKPVHGYSMELITLPLVLDGSNGHKLTEVTFSGVGDTVSVQAVPSLKNAYIQIPDSMSVTVHEHKPMSFWMYQLRTSSDTEQKLRAIRGLGAVQQDPDLQLFMLDYLNKAKEPSVRAALIRSLGELTSGATGTSQIFMNALSDSSDSVRFAAVTALERYPGNSDVSSSLQHLVMGNQPPDIRKRAVQSLQQVDQADHFLSFVKDLVKNHMAESLGDVILPELVQNGDTTAALALAKRYVSEPGPFPIRWHSFRLLKKYSNMVGDWTPIIESMIQDNDPRIRFLGWQNSNKLASNVQNAMIGSYAPDENDARVINVIRGLKDNESRTIIKQE